MKKKLLLLCTAIIITNITFMSCNSAEKKEEIAKEEVNEANEDVREAKKRIK